MPTSSQARILSREDLPSLLFSRIPTHYQHQHHYLHQHHHLHQHYLHQHHKSSEGNTTQTVSLPHINACRSSTSCSPCSLVMDAAVVSAAPPLSETWPRRLPALERRVPHLVCYPSHLQNGAFSNLSNNRPADVEKQEEPSSSDQVEQEVTLKPSAPDATVKRKRQSTVMSRKKKTSKDEGSETARHMSVAGTSRATKKRVPRYKKSFSVDKYATAADSDSDTSDHPDVQLEINLLADSTPDQSAGTDQPEVEPEPKPESEAPAKPAEKKTIKSLYMQLLSIGMSANAFRGIKVQSKEGEKNATEEEAEAALGALASDMVGDTGDHEDEDEDVELIMGSLLTDVGNQGHISMVKDDVKKTPSPPRKPPPQPPKPPPATLPAVETSVDTGQDRLVTGTGAGAGFDLSLLEQNKDLKDEYDLEPKAAPTAEEQNKAFLQSVAGGAAFKTGGEAKKQAFKPIQQEAKKKVYKLPPVRLRHYLPPPNPHLLCIRTPNVDLTHEQVKNMLEAQLGDIVSLQHDPEYLQNGDVRLSPRVMWIFKMEDTSDGNYLKICTDGIIGYDGETLRIRKRDDVFCEENRAYLLVKQIKEEQAKRKRAKNKERKGGQGSPKAKA